MIAEAAGTPLPGGVQTGDKVEGRGVRGGLVLDLLQLWLILPIRQASAGVSVAGGEAGNGVAFQEAQGPYLIGAPLGLGAWALIRIATTPFLPPGGPIAVYAFDDTDAGLDAVIAAGGSILEVRPNAVLAASDDPDFVAKLYGQAPLLAISATGGCGYGRKTPG